MRERARRDRDDRRDASGARRTRGSSPTRRPTRPGSSAATSGARSIVDNLRAYRSTILYGASGVGKSSVLHAGVVRRLCSERGARRGLGRRVAVRRRGRPDDPVAALQEVVGARSRDARAARPDGGARRTRVDGAATAVLLILDQFEEYFLYHPQDEAAGSFARGARARARAAATLPANFLISIREDALAKLDRFEGRVPSLLDNLLRIEHLDRDGGARGDRAAARASGTRRAGDGRARSRSSRQLVDDACSTRSRPGRSVERPRGRRSRRGRAGAGDGRIEAPYLQLVLSRLWDEETRRRLARAPPRDARAARAAPTRIVRTHLDAAMAALPPARAGRRRAALPPPRHAVRDEDRAPGRRPRRATSSVPQDELEPVLDTALAARRASSARPASGAYEIYHDALAGPILDWRARWEERSGAGASGGARSAPRRRGSSSGSSRSRSSSSSSKRGTRATSRARASSRRTAIAELAQRPASEPPARRRRSAQSATPQAEDALRAALGEANVDGVRADAGPVYSAASARTARSS